MSIVRLDTRQRKDAPPRPPGGRLADPADAAAQAGLAAAGLLEPSADTDLADLARQVGGAN